MGQTECRTPSISRVGCEARLPPIGPVRSRKSGCGHVAARSYRWISPPQAILTGTWVVQRERNLAWKLHKGGLAARSCSGTGTPNPSPELRTECDAIPSLVGV